MDGSLFSFIWRFSRRDQLILLAMTVATFPLLFATLELPKRIINDAIGSATARIEIWDRYVTQTEYLMLLCLAFLAAVVAHGLMKMRLNTMKGIVAERLLRRFRYMLLTRMMFQPKPFFRHTSQGELVSMVTSEAEPMGGLMGDAVAQPVFQAGQMLTILVFLFAQSIWFGLASVALIPLQAWLIPRLQRQINLLNKDRIGQVRHLATEIGETAAGVSDIRLNGGLRYRMAVFSDRLGRLFSLRLMIYRKKFFMKFLNNFINQLTPFFFYAAGGYLAIRGEISVGALVAALAAYKDLSAPWKELLTYYTQVQDMSLRWQVVTERFAPKPLVDPALLEGVPDEIPHLDGEIVLDDVTVRDEDGHTVLEDISLTIPRGARVAVQSASPAAATAFANLLTREVLPAYGRVTIAGHPLQSLHQATLAARIGYAHSDPYMFDGTLGDNLMMPLRRRPVPPKADDAEIAQWLREAERSGNSTDRLAADWVDPAVAGFSSPDEVSAWWFQLCQAMGIDRFLVRRRLQSVLDVDAFDDLKAEIVKLRPEIARRIKAAGLDDVVHRYDPDVFNPVAPLGANLLYALPTRPLQQAALATRRDFVRALEESGLAEDILDLGGGVIESLHAAFGADGTDHPLFRALNMEPELYRELVRIAEKRRNAGPAALSLEDRGLLLTVPFAFSAEQIGPAFRDDFRDRVMAFRRSGGAEMVARLGDLFKPIDPGAYIDVKTVLGNAIFGRISTMAGAREERVLDIVEDVVAEAGLSKRIAASLYGIHTDVGAANMPASFRERAAFSRAAIKRPDILILQHALASHDAQSRAHTRAELSRLLPDTTIIYIEDRFNRPENYDLFVEIVDGRIDGVKRQEAMEPVDADARQDLDRKLRAISQAELFSRLDRRNQRLLAFSAQWYRAAEGQVIFSNGQPADAAYLCIRGRAALFWPEQELQGEPITVIEPGRLIGDLAVILDRPRIADLVTQADTLILRIGAKELRAVIESDVAVAKSLLQTVAGHLSSASDLLRQNVSDPNAPSFRARD